MNLILNPSLKQRALAKIAIILWSQNDIRDLMSKSVLHISHVHWQKIEKAVIEKSFKLQLPKMLKEKLLNFIVQVGLQILSWVDFHQCRYKFGYQLPSTFVWTPLGTIDNQSTAKLLLFNDDLDLDIHKTFELACVYCLEDEIQCFWYMFDILLNRFGPTEESYIVSFWSDYMEEFDRQNFHRLDEMEIYASMSYMSLLIDSAKDGNKAATRYFYEKLRTESYHFIVQIAKNIASKLYALKDLDIYFSLENYSGVMLFLLSVMDAEQQAQIFASDTYAVLKCLLVWPWQSLFLETVKDKWDLLSKENYNNLLYDMVCSKGYKYNLYKLFREFWQQSPETYKQFIADQGDIVHLLLGLYQKGDEKTIKLILKDSSISARKKLILGDGCEQICMYLVSLEKWDSVEFLLHECISSREDLTEFRDRFRKYVAALHSRDEFMEEYQWDKFFQLIEDCIFRYNKKRCKEDIQESLV